MASPPSDPPLSGRRAVVTGGGRGIGAATAAALAHAGASVVVSARTTTEIEAVADELGSDGANAFAVACDVGDPDSVLALRDRATELLGGPADIVVANAGVASSAPLHRLELEEWERLFRVNATGVFLTVKAFLPGMVESGWGRVVAVASIAGKMGAPYISGYAASKHAVLGFVRSVAQEVATKGVTVNAVCPGYVETAMTEATVTNIQTKAGLEEEAARKALEAQSPQHRIFTPEEVAYQVLSLCDPRAAGINAQAVVLDGGGVQT